MPSFSIAKGQLKLFKNVVIALGVYTTLKLTIKVIYKIKEYFPSQSPEDLKKKYGDGWVIIVGENNELIQEISSYFLSHNFKILFLSHSLNNLIQIINQLKIEFPKSIIELKKFDINEKFEEFFSNCSILIFFPFKTQSQYLDDLTTQEISTEIESNIEFPTLILNKSIKYMRLRKRSLIITFGSSSPFWAPGKKAIFTGGARYMETLIECLRNENTNIDFTYLSMGPVKNIGDSTDVEVPFAVSPSEYWKKSVNVIGKSSWSFGHWKHEMLQIIFGQSMLLKRMLFKRFISYK